VLLPPLRDLPADARGLLVGSAEVDSGPHPCADDLVERL
jgi:hypothetical protein